MPEGKSEYPADIEAAAWEINLAVEKSETHYEARDVIAKALLAEREACANIASHIATDMRNGGQTRFAAALIANSIRSGDRTSSTEES